MATDRQEEPFNILVETSRLRTKIVDLIAGNEFALRYTQIKSIDTFIEYALHSASRRATEQIERSTPSGASTVILFIRDRLVNVYGESPNVDFVLALERIAQKIREEVG